MWSTTNPASSLSCSSSSVGGAFCVLPVYNSARRLFCSFRKSQPSLNDYYTYERVTHQSVFFQSFFTSVFHMQSVKEVHEISLLLNTCSMFLISYYSWLPFIVRPIKVSLSSSRISSGLLQIWKDHSSTIWLSLLHFSLFLPHNVFLG